MIIGFKIPFSRPGFFLSLFLIVAISVGYQIVFFTPELTESTGVDSTEEEVVTEDYIEEDDFLLKELARAEKKSLSSEATFLSLRKLADCYHRLGEYHKSQKYYNILFYRMKTKYGINDFRLASVADELGTVYYDENKHSGGGADDLGFEDSFLKTATSQIEKAELLIIKALDLREKKFGSRSVAAAKTHLKLGRVLDAQGALDRAEKEFYKSLSIFESNLGPNDPALVEVLSELVSFYNQEPLDFVLKNSDVEIAQLESRLSKIFDRAYTGNFKRTISILPVEGRAFVEKVSVEVVDKFNHDAEICFPLVMGLKPSIQKKVQKELSLKSVVGDWEDNRGWLTDVNYEVTYNKNNILSLEYLIEGCGAYPSSMIENVCIDLKSGRRVKLSSLIKESSLNELAKIVDEKIKCSVDAQLKDFPGDRESIITTCNQALTGEIDAAADELAPFTKSNFGSFLIYESGINFNFEFGFPHIAKAMEPDTGYFVSYKTLKPHLKPNGPLGFIAREGHCP